MITEDLQYVPEEGYIRYSAPNTYYTPDNSIYDILDVVSGDIFQDGSPMFAYQGSTKPFVIKFRDMQVGDNIRFVLDPFYIPVLEDAKLPVLSMTINGEEILLPSKMTPEIEEDIYTAYTDYQVTQNINNIDISLFVREDMISNGTTIFQEPSPDVYKLPDGRVFTRGVSYIDVKRANTEPPNEGTTGTLADGLLAHYSFNNGSLQDMSGNGNDLVQVGNVYDATNKDGQIGQAKEITDIGGNYLKWEIKNLINGTENAVSMWVYIPDLAHSGAFFSIGSGGPYSTTPRLLLGQRDDVLEIIVNGIGSSTEITVGWHNIIYNGRKLYVDKVFRNYMDPLIMDGFLYLFTGYYTELVCKLDEVRVYNRVLTDDDNLSFGETTTGEVAEIFDMEANYLADTEPPTFNTINLSTITSNSFSLNIECNENARVYYKLLKSGNTSPTSAELKTIHEGDIAFTANVLSTISGVGLSPNTEYDLYVVAEDLEYNLQITPTKISFSTTANSGIKGTPNEGINGTLGNGLVAHYSFNDGSLEDSSGNGNDAIAVGTPALGLDKDGQAGQALVLYNVNYIYSSPFTQANEEMSVSFMFKAYAEDTPIITFVNDFLMSETIFYASKFIGIYCSGLGNINTGINILDNTYHQLLFLFKSTGIYLYLDKKYIGKFDQTIDYFISKICFGKSNFSGGDLSIDEVRVYNRRLTGETSIVGQEPTLEIAEIFDMGANYEKKINNKISEIIFNIDFDKATHLGTFIEVKYLDIKADGVSILDKNPIVKYWNNYNNTVRVFDPEGERFGTSLDLYFQIECDGYETSDVIHKELKMIHIDGYHGDYSGGGSGGGLANYAYHNNDNYKKSEARILIPLTNTSFISYKK